VTEPVALQSLSLAMDGGFMATADISRALEQVGAGDRYRLIGGLTVMLHVQRLGLDLPIRATGDADFGLSPVALREPTLVDAIEQLGYRRVAGNRWERPVDERRIATVDLLAPSYTARARHDIRFGDVVTSEILGLAEAFLRPSVSLDARLVLTTGEEIEARLSPPGAVATLALKCGARATRDDSRDAEDLWRCLEVAAAEGVDASMFDEPPWTDTRQRLAIELIDPGRALPAITDRLRPDAAARMRTRIRALLLDVAGIST
jgi:hypothetical protein